MRRVMRAVGAVLAFLALATPAPPPPSQGPGEPAVARLFAEPVPVDPRAPGERHVGPFRYLGGWVLTSDDRRFGSISAMHVEGDTILALGDRGTLFRFAVPGPGALTVAIRPLARGPGAFSSSVERDSESMAVAGGEAWLGYENSNQIWRYRLPAWEPMSRAAPEAMRDWPANRGAEAMARLSDGSFLVIGEDEDEDGASPAVLFPGDPSAAGTPAIKLSYRLPRGHRITDAASLPNGRMLLLSRGFSVWSGWSAKLLTANAPERSGEVIQTWEVAFLARPLTVDNMEALSVTREQGRTIVWIASDDNLNPVQRTLLMKFALAE